MYIAGVPNVGYEYGDVYRWCAHCRMRVQQCILLVRPPYNVCLGMYVASAPTVRYESRDVYR